MPATSFVQSQEVQPSATQASTILALQGSPSTQNVPAVSLGNLDSPRLPSIEVHVTSSAELSGAPQCTEPGEALPPQEDMEASETIRRTTK